MRRYSGVLPFVILVTIGLGLVGCLPAAGPATASLLEQDYLSMPDADLVAYEQGLSDEIVNSSRYGNGGFTVGLGFGSWGNNLGYGLGADQQLGATGDSDQTLELKARRDAVRAEMRRRGLLP